ncbi:MULTISPECIES: hypothetical protein [unclassified Haladaptatus]|uniref:hypothetical protein n=1 Tax=unclassified Haladaptatus TaxID=2622732 RepID=UPI00209BDB84|nr:MULTISPECIES: hypothetical protein [unclassified Haladaptatus]MCO8246354.1 hypothetical protein [Haladaptatus sp. AB643]MCO8255257.1 hypothetical protein [Haladaptatus sp. AB618]
MEFERPESRWKRVAIIVGIAFGFLAVSFVAIPVVLLAGELLAGIVVGIVRVITEPRTGQHPA